MSGIIVHRLFYFGQETTTGFSKKNWGLIIWKPAWQFFAIEPRFYANPD